MSLVFTEKNLNEIYTITSGLSKSSEEFGFGFPFLSFKTIFYNYYINEDLDELVNSTEEEQKKHSVKKGDVFLTRTSETLDELGMSCVALRDYPNATFNGFTKRLRPKKDNIIYPLYACYYFRSTLFRKYVDSMAIMTTRASLNNNILSKLPIIFPNYEDQKKIGYLLHNLDKKIELNKEINKNLEDTILKIFDSWFVKFELSNEFSDSKLGLIPKGWKIDYLGSKKSCSIIRSSIDEFDNSKIYVATADVDNSIITSNDTLITMNDKPSRANMQPIAKSIWFVKMIDSRKLIMIDDYCSDLLNNYIFSTGFCGLKCVDKYFYYLWAFLLTDAFDVMKNNFCTGTTMQAINNKDTKLIEFVLPDDNIINQFNVIAKPMFKKIYYNSLEIKKLQKLRDTLLPKLMSGEIDVSKINCDLKIIIRKIYIKFSKLFLWRYLSENQNHIKNTKSNETLLKSRTIYQINKFLAKFNARYRYYRQQ